MDRGRNAREEDGACFRAFNLLVSGFGIPLPHQLPVKLFPTQNPGQAPPLPESLPSKVLPPSPMLTRHTSHTT